MPSKPMLERVQDLETEVINIKAQISTLSLQLNQAMQVLTQALSQIIAQSSAPAPSTPPEVL